MNKMTWIGLRTGLVISAGWISSALIFGNNNNILYFPVIFIICCTITGYMCGDEIKEDE